MTKRNRALIFWGAGATAALGISTTEKQATFIATIADDNRRPDLESRIRDALTGDDNALRRALFELITILGDRRDSYERIDDIDNDELAAMSRNWRASTDERNLRSRIIAMRMAYDWPALKCVVQLCPGFDDDKFKINDLFNLLDLHIAPGHGFRAPLQVGREPKFLNAQRLIGARRALMMILGALFHIEYRTCIASKQPVLVQYRDFAAALGRRARGIAIASGKEPDQPDFFRSDVSFVSLNYDPIGLWVQFIANRELNHAGAPHIGSPATPVHVYHDFGNLIPARRVTSKADKNANWPWYPLNEAAAERLNECGNPSGYRVVLTKFLFPHGSLCWRECSDCGKLSAYHGDDWVLESSSLFPPPPLLAFDPSPVPDRIQDHERKARERGEVDARACLHCGTLNFANNTQAVMQSSFKPRPPSFIEEIQRDLRAAAMAADHFIFMGYSLPPDDVDYRALFAARRKRSTRDAGEPRCTVVSLDQEHSG